MNKKIIELSLDIETIGPEGAVLPQEKHGPTTLRITPVEEIIEINGIKKTQITFRVAFEPENENRRSQPYREGIAPVFPKGWKLGDPFDPKDDDRFV